ncbi:hypothetical protein [Aeromonas veronii]|uniref:hypothetical protein n=1 Tax=Aeromonas veronii TaxID=654 RepID=UPI00195FCDBD|nr:hypothetical protein [Aeromonas veronii]
MQGIMPPVSTPDNLFHDGDPTQGIEGTIVTAEHLNNEQAAIRNIQQELINVLTLAEMEPDPDKLNQISESIGIIVAKGIQGANMLPGSSYKPRTDSLNTRERQVEIIKNKDMNTCKAGEFGLYEKATCANSPPNAGQLFYCETKATSHAFLITQLTFAYDNNIGVMAWRNLTATQPPVGSDWCEVYDTHNKPTAAECGAAPAVHSHTAAQANADIVSGGVGQVGTHGLFTLVDTGAPPVGPGGVYAGTQLKWSNVSANNASLGISPPGSWKALSTINAGAAVGTKDATGLFIRIA